MQHLCRRCVEWHWDDVEIDLGPFDPRSIPQEYRLYQLQSFMEKIKWDAVGDSVKDCWE
jgi:hypothetical protein